jgi:hypothetical protein
MSPRPRRLEVAIDELVLHGFDPRQRGAIAAALRTELAAALQGWSLAAGTRVTHLEAGSFTMPAAAPPGVVGRGVARQISQLLHGPISATTQQAGARQASVREGRS